MIFAHSSIELGVKLMVDAAITVITGVFKQG